MKTKLLLVAAVALSLPAVAQTNSQTTLEVEHMSSTPTFRVVVISRSVQAVNYKHRSGSSKLDFAGTTLMPSANGVAEVNSHRGSIVIDTEFGDLQKPTTFRQRVSHLRFMGDFARGPRCEFGRSAGRRQSSQQAPRYY